MPECDLSTCELLQNALAQCSSSSISSTATAPPVTSSVVRILQILFSISKDCLFALVSPTPCTPTPACCWGPHDRSSSTIHASQPIIISCILMRQCTVCASLHSKNASSSFGVVLLPLLHSPTQAKYMITGLSTAPNCGAYCCSPTGFAVAIGLGRSTEVSH